MQSPLKRKNVSLCMGVFVIVLLLLPMVSFALQWPPSPAGTHFDPLNKATTVPLMIQYFFEWAVTLGGLATFIMLLVAGFQYLTSTGDPGKTKDARDRIAAAVGGLVLLLSSVIILKVINPELLGLRVPQLETLVQVDCTKDENKGEPVCISPGSVFPYAGSCDKVYIYPQKNYEGKPTSIEVKKTPTSNGEVDAESECTPIPIIKNRGSVKFVYIYTDPETKVETEKDGGLCEISLYDESTNCDKTGAEAVALIFSQTKDISRLYLKKNIRSAQVKGYGADKELLEEKQR